MYADDNNLTYSSKNPDDLCSSHTHDHANLKEWLDSNRLSLNVLKTKCLFTETRHKISQVLTELHVFLDSHSIERVRTTNAKACGWMKHFLGVLICQRSVVKSQKYLLS